MRTGGMSARPVLAAWLEIAGTIYFGAMFLRLVIGLSVPLAPAWFSATIPAFFHLVLAAYILVLAGYLRPAPNAIGAEDIP
jgi:hypothetical protein